MRTPLRPLGARARTILAGSIVLLCATSSCKAKQPRMASFDAREYYAYSQTGSGVVEGQAFLRMPDGVVRYGASAKVQLHPVTFYSDEWYERAVLNGENLEGWDPRSDDYARKTKSDEMGNFRFAGLPEGEYYVACWIGWEEGEDEHGAYAHSRVKVRDGATTRVVVTR